MEYIYKLYVYIYIYIYIYMRMGGRVYPGIKVLNAMVAELSICKLEN